MKRLKIVGVYLLLSCTLQSVAQGGDKALNQDPVSAQVDGALRDLESGLYTSFAQKRLERLGDETATTIIRNHTLEEMENESVAIGIAKAISLAFTSPNSISLAGDRQPKNSIILVTYLRATVP